MMPSKPQSQSNQVSQSCSSKSIKAPPLDSLEQINLNAAGLDIGDKQIYACVPEGRDTNSVRVFQLYG
jgi:hypothetical protein